MNPKAGKKLPFGAGMLILAIIGSFIFSGQSLLYEKSDRDMQGSNIYFSAIINRSVDCLAENTPTVSKAHRNSNSLFRIYLLRVFTLTGIVSIAMLLAQSNLKTSKNKNFMTSNYLVPLKLRI